MTGDSSVALYPREHVTFFGDECSKDDSIYRSRCSLLIKRHLHNLHTMERASDALPRFSYYETLPDSFGGWFQMWEEEAHIFDVSDDAVKQKVQLYGALGAAFLHTYWHQNVELKDPQFCYGTSQPLQAAHPHGGDYIEQYISQTREVDLRWVQHVRRELVRNGRLADRYDPVVVVVFTTDFWEESPQISVRRDFRYVEYDNTPLRSNPGYRGRVAMTYRRKQDTCVRASWLYKKTQGNWPIAVVFYQLLSGICFPCWTRHAPKIAKQTSLPPFEGKRRKKKKGEDQFSLGFIQPPHPHPFEKTEVVWAKPHQKLPWADIKRR